MNEVYMISTLGAIALGGAIGALARFGANAGVEKILGTGFPWGTLLINIAGCMVMGVFMAKAGQAQNVSPELKSFIATGFLGAFTTFSTFSLDFMRMWERGEFLPAGLYLTASVLLSILGLYLGQTMIRGYVHE